MSTYFLKSNAVEVFPSGYRSAGYTKARAMIEENFVNLTKFTDDRYRNFAFQPELTPDQIVAVISGYRFTISVPELYNTLCAADLYNGDEQSWECYLYIKFADLEEEGLSKTYGKILQNLDLRDSSNLEQLDDTIDGESGSFFFGLGVTRNINDLVDSSYIKVQFTRDMYNDEIHRLQTKFLSISSYNIRNGDSDFNLTEQINTSKLKLDYVDARLNKFSTNLTTQYPGAGLERCLINITSQKDDEAEQELAKVGFATGGEIMISGEVDSESALRLSRVGDDTHISAGLTGPGSRSADSSVKILYSLNTENPPVEGYLTLPKDPIYDATYNNGDELVWVKSINKRQGEDPVSMNSWRSLNSAIDQRIIHQIRSTQQVRIEIIKWMYPVGSIFTSRNGTDPNKQLLGVSSTQITWRKITSNCEFKNGDLDLELHTWIRMS